MKTLRNSLGRTEKEVVESFLEDIAPLLLPRIPDLETLADEINKTSSCVVLDMEGDPFWVHLWNGKLQLGFESEGRSGRNKGEREHRSKFSFAHIIKETIETACNTDNTPEGNALVKKNAKNLRRFAKMLNKAADELNELEPVKERQKP